MTDNRYPADPDDYQAKYQGYPASEAKMSPRPVYYLAKYKAADKLAGRKAFVTGGDSGIGRAVAVAFAKEGADVAVGYNKSEDDASETAEAIEREGRTAVTVGVDISTLEGCKEAMRRALDGLGGIGILVNNAAYAQMQPNILDLTDEQLVRVFDTNVLAAFRLAKLAIPHMSRGDSIINTSSVGGKYGAAPFVDYSATKGALDAFTRSLAQALGDRGIRVNCVVPGAFWTPFQEAYNMPEAVQQMPEGVAQLSAAGRFGQPEEIASTYVYLAAPDASFTNGITIDVDGGWKGI